MCISVRETKYEIGLETMVHVFKATDPHSSHRHSSLMLLPDTRGHINRLRVSIKVGNEIACQLPLEL